MLSEREYVCLEGCLICTISIRVEYVKMSFENRGNIHIPTKQDTCVTDVVFVMLEFACWCGFYVR